MSSAYTLNMFFALQTTYIASYVETFYIVSQS